MLSWRFLWGMCTFMYSIFQKLWMLAGFGEKWRIFLYKSNRNSLLQRSTKLLSPMQHLKIICRKSISNVFLQIMRPHILSRNNNNNMLLLNENQNLRNQRTITIIYPCIRILCGNILCRYSCWCSWRFTNRILNLTLIEWR